MKLFESFSETIFFILEFTLILGTLGVILLTDIVYSAFLLGFVFACVALLYLLLDSDFVAAAQILIYVGAINVLIVFAVMLINKKKSDSLFLFWTIGDGITFVICISIFLVLNNAISTTSWSKISLFIEGNKNEKLILTDNIRRIGSGFLTEFIVPFELMSIILLIALIGAIVLARGEQLINPMENPLERKK
uniref:NAD(P)H-quinone oxidoreductase subunit 6, chloroplastic n=1 Tax=Cheilolejeunea xanthocarpa TaxID=414193 RepID=A0A4Y5P529_9MARC|nr:NADH-plastoquinone oxidoreductase subunit 6 [Cheilolejeunea xanthocarpa]QCW58401.1 NADH-plastoquinone oxidoreductase subunit 6 [Cheilolejeunea xanthocarpa]